MPRKKQQVSIGRINKNLVVGIFSVLMVVGVFGTVLVARQQTQWSNHAAEPIPPYQATTNLNRASEILSSINADGTMGPQSAYGNWSNSLPSFLKGQLVFGVTDPVQTGKPTNTGATGLRPSDVIHIQPTQALPTHAQGTVQATAGLQEPENGPQTVTALTLTMTKVEVHLAYQGKNAADVQLTPGERAKPPLTQVPTGTIVDHWETLRIPNPTSVDFVALAKTSAIAPLGITNLAEGRYTEVRLYISTGTARLSDGTLVPLQIIGHDNIIRIVEPFAIVSGQATKLTIDLNAQQSVIKAGAAYQLKPVVARFLNDHQVQ